MANDPRAENCRGYRLDGNGKVVGVYLEHRPMPSALYELISVVLLDEYQAAGTTEALCMVLDKNGIQTAERVYLTWPYFDLSHKQLPGNAEGKHMITGPGAYYDSSKAMGALSLFVGDAQGNVISDLIGGLGLPDNRHVSYRATWKERRAPTEPEEPAEPEEPEEPTEPPVEVDEYDARFLAAIERGADALKCGADALKRLADHLGA